MLLTFLLRVAKRRLREQGSAQHLPLCPWTGRLDSLCLTLLICQMRNNTCGLGLLWNDMRVLNRGHLGK